MTVFLFLLLALQDGLWIDVPYIQQDKNGCGSASIWMVMEHWRPGSARPVEEIQDQLYSEQAGGIWARDMEKYFVERAYRVFAFEGRWEDFESHIAKGRPLIVSLEQSARGAPLHYVVVAGIDTARNLVLVNDPAQRKLRSIHRSEFERAWKASGNWTLLAVPETDLAGSAFREQKLAEAGEHLRSALRSDPSDAYTNEFLATVHFLQNNIESALKYWNRVGKPEIGDIRIDPPLRVDPVLLDRAFTFSRGSLLTLDDYRTTRSRLDAMGIFSRHHLDVSPAGGSEGDRFDVTLRAAERNGAGFFSWLRGLPYETVYPEFSNLGGKAINLKSMLRWDAHKRRAQAELATPLGNNPKWTARYALDYRDENWRRRPEGEVETFHMKKVEASAQIGSIPDSRWTWHSGAALSQRAVTDPAYRSGVALKYLASVTRAIVQDPDRRLEIDASLSFQAGKMFTSTRDRFAKIENRLSLRWLPFPAHPDYELSARWRAGRAFGALPFDESFVMGLDRDSGLWLRAHPAAEAGFKNADLARRSFVLVNADFQKVIRDTGFFRLAAGPFLDASRGPVFDTGVQLRLTLLGALTLNASYGRSLTENSHAFFLH